jgi:hypothetical protein
MPRYRGPCLTCGVPVDRPIKPHRQNLCIDCAIEVGHEYHRALAAGTHPDLERMKAAGRETARQIRARRGPQYEKWRKGIRDAWDRD